MPRKQPTDIDIAALTVEKTKRALDAAKINHNDAMEKLIDLTGVKEEGSKTEKWNYFKTTTKAVINRNIDADMLDELSEAKKIPTGLLSRLIKWKPELILSEYRKLEKKELRIVAKFVTEKPGKSTVTVERLKAK